MPTPPPDRITVHPSPPKEGDGATICYDYDGIAIPTTKQLNIQWRPDTVTGPTPVFVSPEDNCVDIVIPAGATSLTITDPSGQSAPFTGAVQP